MMKLAEPVSPTLSPTFAGASPAKPRLRRHRLLIAAIAGIVILAIGAVGYTQLTGSTSSASTVPSTDVPVADLKLVHPYRQTIRKTIEQPGRLEGYEQTSMYVKMSGFVREWKTDIGARVKPGDILAELSVPEEVEELKRREANAVLALAEVVAAERALDAATADEAKAEAVVRQATATKSRTDANVVRWKAEFKRTEQIRDRGAASQNDYDVALESLRTAEAGVAEAKAGIESATAALASAAAAKVRASASVAVAKAQVAVAEADARRQREWLKYATVTAPFAGVVAQRYAEVGQYVMVPTSGSSQPPLFVVVRTDPVRVFVDVPESEAVLINEGMPAVVRIQSLGDVELAARVSRVSWVLDRDTRTLRVQIDLPNPDGTLRPGMFAIARFNTERPAAWVVPAGVVVTTDEQPYAVRIENGKSIKTPVKIGVKQNGLMELLQKQIQPVPRGEPIPWESLTGTENFLTTRPAGWTDGMPLKVAE